MEALRVNEKMTVGLVREAAGQVGEVVANLVHFYNPARIVVGGGLTVPATNARRNPRCRLPAGAAAGHPQSGHRPSDTRRMVRHVRGLVLGIEHALTPDALAAFLAPGRRR